MNPPQRPGAQPVALPPRPQVGIERLPTRHLATEPRESMNCKSCRKRKIKCNRLRPSCEACQVFQCPCIYDAVPKKRGPKTDVLEALLKRVDGLEAKLKEKNEGERSALSTTQDSTAESSSSALKTEPIEPDTAEPAAKRVAIEDTSSPAIRELPVYSPRTPAVGEPATPPIHTDVLLDSFFTRFHNKPYHILDESTVRKRIQSNQLPTYLFDAIAAVAAKHTLHPNGYQAAAKLSEEYAARSRNAIDTDEPCIDALQALLLLVLAYIAGGKGKKAYMLMTNAVGMIIALELHREVDGLVRIPPSERELRRRIFWACYLLDRYAASGSKRPSLISDESIFLNLPAYTENPSGNLHDGEAFLYTPYHYQGTSRKFQGSTGMLIDITRILGVTNRYLAAGGVKGDSHFPWHSLSNLSKIRQDLDLWFAGTGGLFTNVDAISNHPESTILVLSKLIYHCIHCLIYRPFLPITLAELASSGQQESWQIEAMNICFYHANSIAELIQVAKQSGSIEWPPFVGYCICTAGTVHVHGAHYSKQHIGEMQIYSSSTEFLSREIQLLGDLRYTWGIVQHQRDTLQRLYQAHGELVAKALSGNPMRYAPGFHQEDFFDRYSNIGGPGGISFHFDTANLSLSDEMLDFTNEPKTIPELQPQPVWENRPNLKRKTTAQSPHQHILDMKPQSNPPPTHTPALAGATYPPRNSMAIQNTMMPPHSSPGMGTMSSMLPAHMEQPPPQQHISMRTPDVSSPNGTVVAGYGLTHSPQTAPGGMTPLAGISFSPAYNYNMVTTPNSTGQPVINDGSGGYDAMFGMPTNAFGSPVAWPSHPMGHTTPGAAAPSPSTKSNTGSTGTAGDEKDPFMSLLEQLANNEQRGNGMKSELDFFLSSGGHS